jgi:hypothetical protein
MFYLLSMRKDVCVNPVTTSQEGKDELYSSSLSGGDVEGVEFGG